MATDDMKSIRVHILGREYALRVREGEEKTTRNLAAQVNARMEAFKDAHPEQAELTTAVITALTMAEEISDLKEELETSRDTQDARHEALNRTLSLLSDRLTAALPSGALPRKDPLRAAGSSSNEEASADEDRSSSDESASEDDSSDASDADPEMSVPPPTLPPSASDGHADTDASPAIVPREHTDTPSE